MNIGMFLDSSFPPDPRVENEATSLIEAGHTVHLFSTTLNQSLPKKEVINGIQVHRFHINRLIYKMSALAYTFPFYRYLISSKIKKFLIESNPDVLHIHDMVIAPSVLDINSKRLPVILDLHENRPAIMKEYRHINKFPGNMLINLQKWEKGQRRIIKNSDYIIFVTEEARESALAENSGLEKNKCIVVPNTIKQDIFMSYPIQSSIHDRLKGKFNLLYLGDTSLRRGLEVVIKSLPGLIEEIPEVQLVIVGSSSEDHILKELVRNLGLESRVLFEGWQDVKLFPSYITSCHIGLSPLKRNPHHDTTFANKVFQYMALGLPQIVSNCTSQANLIESTRSGLIFESGKEKDFRNKVLALYQSASIRMRLSANGKKSVEEEWNWDSTSKPLINLYHQLTEDLPMN